MDDTSKYIIHATVAAEGVVERSDVVGAIFGQTEGLLGDELDLRDLRQSQKVGRIDVEVASANGESRGRLAIATNLDKVETATLAASLETITRVGPCRANIEIESIEDVRAAKRKKVVERAKELVRTGFDDTVMSSEEILSEVREHVRVEDITEYDGLPAGPRVTDGDAIIVVEGRADVLTMLKYGIKNAIAVEGTNVPDAVAELTRHRTVTAFLDGDRGGELILEELAQVGDVDYVAFAPAGSSVEDLDHHQVFAALRNKVPYGEVEGRARPRDAVAATDGSATPAPPARDEVGSDGPSTDRPTAPDAGEVTRGADGAGVDGAGDDAAVDAERAAPDAGESATEGTASVDGSSATDVGDEGVADSGTASTYEHVDEVVRSGSDRVRLLDDDGAVIDEVAAGDAYEALSAADEVPSTMVLDGILSQRLLDLAADRGVSRIVARSLGQFTKRPTGVRVHAADEVADVDPTDS